MKYATKVTSLQINIVIENETWSSTHLERLMTSFYPYSSLNTSRNNVIGELSAQLAIPLMWTADGIQMWPGHLVSDMCLFSGGTASDIMHFCALDYIIIRIYGRVWQAVGKIPVNLTVQHQSTSLHVLLLDRLTGNRSHCEKQTN